MKSSTQVMKGQVKRGFLSLFMATSLVISLIASFGVQAGHVSAAVSIQAVAACTDAAWDASKTYTAGNRVSQNGKVYEAKWWTTNENPQQSAAWGAWKYISDCGTTTTPPTGDTTAPTAPASLTSTAKTATSVTLAWSASTDNVGVTGYNVYNGSTLSSTVTGTTATVAGLTASTAYSFSVKAKDAAGNLSAASNVLSVTTSASTTPNPGTTPSKVIGAYVADWSFPDINTVPATKLTHVYYAFANAANNAVSGGDTGKLAQLVSLKQKNPNLKVLISVGGWGNSAGFSGIASSDANRTAFANSALSYIRANKLDGIDIDWEYPTTSDKANYTLFLKKLREVLDAGSAADGRSNNKYQITAATGASQYGIEGIDLASVQQYFDYINIMTYDMQVGNNTHHTNLYTSSLNSSYSVDNAVKLYKANGVSPSKIVIGGAFYSHGTAEYTYDELLASYINKNGWTRQWDDVAKAPYLTNGTSFLSYDDEQSLTEKVKYLKAQGLAGIMFWEYGQNTGGQLLNAIYTAVQQP
ncbi:chitinase [Paenibacillus shirakamiensis]|uniref:chitinase n=1 Tax=Paenibacillus shirakamiensis TaxID=1265935 RepID=A0ABS4JFG0_9BACL|nr:glycosyl hydrolase family 18 protein [Paenibacillus shirakamiensis]MBP2000447.1 chitinase [Paenibacillus shirakamiensis]